MKPLLSLTCLVFSLSILAQQPVKSNIPTDFEAYLKEQNEKVSGKEYPAFSIKLPDASVFSNADLADHTVFINFWFEACAPCIREMDALNELYTKLAGNPNFMFVSFTFDPDSIIQKQVELLKIKYKVIHIDRDECYRLNFGSGFPSSFLLDRKGIIRHYKAGGDTDKKKARKSIMTEIYPKIAALL